MLAGFAAMARPCPIYFLQNHTRSCSYQPASICCAPIENPQKLTPPLLSSNSDHCGILQVLVLRPRNRAMESAAVTHSNSAHF